VTARKKIFKQLLKYLGQTVLVLFITLGLFEISYRYYWIDFYGGELKGLNSKEDLSLSKSKTILVFGDSFSANTEGWVSVLRDSLIDYNVINSAVPGTSVFHQKLFFEDRVQDFKPDKIIIQLYVGNDLIDYERPINFSNLGFARNIYWWISDSFISLQYLNYKSGQFSSKSNKLDPKNDESFDVNSYNKREKNYHQADDLILNNSINIEGSQKEVFQSLLADLDNMIAELEIPIYILVIPHGCQLGGNNLKNIELLGAKLSDVTKNDYPFYNKIKTWAAKKSNIKVVNALPELKQSNINEAVFYNNDPHLNLAGEKTIVNLLLETINKSN
jgi:hypothetical protein